MAFPVFDGFSLQDEHYILEEIEYRNMPARSLSAEKIARRAGMKLLSHEWGPRVVKMKGAIVADSASDLRAKIDELHQYVTSKDEGVLAIESDRTGTATVSQVTITDPHYAQDYVPFEIEFFMADPFFYGPQLMTEFTVVSGTSSMTETITISGSAFAEPSIRYIAPVTGGGYTTTSGVSIEYVMTSERITWSGTSRSTMSYDSTLTFDYSTHRILEDLVAVDVEGVFARWQPGAATFTTTFSGLAQGGTLEFNYRPRYL